MALSPPQHGDLGNLLSLKPRAESANLLSLKLKHTRQGTDSLISLGVEVQHVG